MAEPARAGRRKVWQQVEDRERGHLSARWRRRPGRRRVAVVYDIDGPRVRLGVVWFVAQVAAVASGVYALALLYGAMGGVAGSQTARAWRQRKRTIDIAVAAAVGGALPLVASLGSRVLGAGVLLAVGGVAVAAHLATPTKPWAATAATAATLQSGMLVGLAAASPVIVYRLEIGAAVALLLLVAAYEVGDYIVGTGAANAVEGPAAGIAGMIVVTFTISVLGIPPYDSASAWLFGALAAASCPVGQVVGSLVLPSAAASAPALRRLDSLLVLGPVWVVGTAALV